MNDKTNPEVTAEETENVAEEAVDAAEEEITEAAQDAAAEEETFVDINEAAENAADEKETFVDITDGYPESKADAEVKKPAKKKGFIQTPVLISLCIVLLSLIGYFVYSAFFLREPDGRIFWSDPIVWEHKVDLEGDSSISYYYQFGKDGVFKAYVGSVEVTSTYTKSSSKENGKTISVGTDFGDFLSNTDIAYTISGSRILGNQKLSGTYDNDIYKFELKQVKQVKNYIEVPENFKPKKDLVGTWNYTFLTETIRAVFNEDGTMSVELISDKNNSVKYNGTYTYDDSTINFTYYSPENTTAPVPYKLDGDYLVFMGNTFTREGSDAEATVDQQLYIPQN